MATSDFQTLENEIRVYETNYKSESLISNSSSKASEFETSFKRSDYINLTVERSQNHIDSIRNTWLIHENSWKCINNKSTKFLIKPTASKINFESMHPNLS